MIRLLKYTFVILSIIMLFIGCKESDETYNIGLSQYDSTTRDKEIERQIVYYQSLHDNYDVEFASADNNVNKQIQQIESFISASVDAIIISSIYPEKLCGVIDEALERGIEVILLDKKSKSSRYSAFIANSDNHTGVLAARRYANMFDDSTGHIIELLDSENIERSRVIHNSFIDRIDPTSQVVVATVSDNTPRVNKVIDSLMLLYPDTKMIFAHSNRVGILAQQRCNNTYIDICGIGYDTESVIDIVINGKLNASVLYPTVGTNAMQAVRKFASGERVERDQSVYPQMIDKYNIKAIRKQYRSDRKLYHQIELLNNKVTDQKKLTLLHKLLIVIIIIIALVTICVIIITSRRRTKRLQSKIRELLSKQSTTPIAQREDPLQGVSIQDQKFVVRLGQIIDGNLADPDFDVVQMSEKLNYSNIQAYRKIKALTGETPSSLLRGARIKRGDYLLRNTDKTIAEIATEVGFTTPAIFSKYYKVIYGVLPSKIAR